MYIIKRRIYIYIYRERDIQKETEGGEQKHTDR